MLKLLAKSTNKIILLLRLLKGEPPGRAQCNYYTGQLGTLKVSQSQLWLFSQNFAILLKRPSNSLKWTVIYIQLCFYALKTYLFMYVTENLQPNLKNVQVSHDWRKSCHENHMKNIAGGKNKSFWLDLLICLKTT